jgi:hypothetical protein
MVTAWGTEAVANTDAPHHRTGPERDPDGASGKTVPELAATRTQDGYRQGRINHLPTLAGGTELTGTDLAHLVGEARRLSQTDSPE